ncbi:MAG: hypothetical protein IJ593_05855 [Lachnospiraceae bacterium]|nr:hypothetical protein [Lachnospiraceae bacterium]
MSTDTISKLKILGYEVNKTTVENLVQCDNGHEFFIVDLDTDKIIMTHNKKITVSQDSRDLHFYDGRITSKTEESLKYIITFETAHHTCLSDHVIIYDNARKNILLDMSKNNGLLIQHFKAYKNIAATTLIIDKKYIKIIIIQDGKCVTFDDNCSLGGRDYFTLSIEQGLVLVQTWGTAKQDGDLVTRYNYGFIDLNNKLDKLKYIKFEDCDDLKKYKDLPIGRKNVLELMGIVSIIKMRSRLGMY